MCAFLAPEVNARCLLSCCLNLNLELLDSGWLADQRICCLSAASPVGLQTQGAVVSIFVYAGDPNLGTSPTTEPVPRGFLFVYFLRPWLSEICYALSRESFGCHKFWGKAVLLTSSRRLLSSLSVEKACLAGCCDCAMQAQMVDSLFRLSKLLFGFVI